LPARNGQKHPFNAEEEKTEREHGYLNSDA
jgi:hypothetical protein